jgi:hypothetical protein
MTSGKGPQRRTRPRAETAKNALIPCWERIQAIQAGLLATGEPVSAVSGEERRKQESQSMKIVEALHPCSARCRFMFC